MRDKYPKPAILFAELLVVQLRLFWMFLCWTTCFWLSVVLEFSDFGSCWSLDCTSDFDRWTGCWTFSLFCCRDLGFGLYGFVLCWSMSSKSHKRRFHLTLTFVFWVDLIWALKGARYSSAYVNLVTLWGHVTPRRVIIAATSLSNHAACYFKTLASAKLEWCTHSMYTYLMTGLSSNYTDPTNDTFRKEKERTLLSYSSLAAFRSVLFV